MVTTTELRQEHDTIRQWLDRLEALLPASEERRPPLVYVLRRITDRLAAHLAHEHELYSSIEEVWWGADPVVGRIRHDHDDTNTTLNLLDRLLTQGHGASLETLETYIRHLLDTLREHMAAEETRLFPLIDRLLAQRAQAPGPMAQMSVNRIIRLYPKTEPVFREFRINREDHGSEHLEEAAWYCGVCMEEIEQALRAAIARHLAAQDVPTAAGTMEASLP